MQENIEAFAPKNLPSVSLVSSNESCSICDNIGVVNVLTCDGDLSSTGLCGVCTYGESQCIYPDEWAAGEVLDSLDEMMSIHFPQKENQS